MRKSILSKIVRTGALICACLFIFSSFSAYAEEDTVNRDTKSSTWVLYDGLDRTMPEAAETGSERKDKKVLMFYHNWHTDFMSATANVDPKAPRNVTKILTDNEDALTNNKCWGGAETYHYWGEPLFGYYSLRNDEYVIRKHSQMLTDAGVDGIVLDYSNYMGGKPIESLADMKMILKTFLKIREEGKKTPQIVILATWDYSVACKTVQNFYDEFYTKPEYDDLWFRLDGKPLFLAWDVQVSQELKDYFTLRRSYPFNDRNFSENEWPWLDAYPQKLAYTASNPKEMMSVGVAGTALYDNPGETFGGGMSSVDENGNFIAPGRSSTSKNKILTTDPASSEYKSWEGASFQENFDRAIKEDPDIIMVTGWNEWIAARFLNAPGWADWKNIPTFGVFCDQFCAEFSRDIEPTRDGGLLDHFYNQLAINIRRFKGTGEQKTCAEQKTLPMDGDFTKWDAVTDVYFDDTDDISVRNAKGIGRNKYTNDTGRNDFDTMKVAYDAENVYFYVKTKEVVSPYTDSSWMYLFLRVGTEEKGWEGWQYIVNRTDVRDGLTTLEHSTGGWNWEKICDVSYVLKENEMELCIPRSSLGIAETDSFTVDFKWMDNMQEQGDPLEFYTNGDCAPNERYSYRFTTEEIKKPADDTAKSTVNKPMLIGLCAAGLAVAGAVAALIAVIKKKR